MNRKMTIAIIIGLVVVILGGIFSYFKVINNSKNQVRHHLVLEMDTPAMFRSMAFNKDDLVEKALQMAEEETLEGSDLFIDVFCKKIEEAGSQLDLYFGKRGDTNQEIISYLKNEEKLAVDRSGKILRKRLKAFGVRHFTVEIEGNNRLIIEMPAKSDSIRIKNLLGKTAILEFKLLNFQDFAGTIGRIDSLLVAVPDNYEKVISVQDLYSVNDFPGKQRLSNSKIDFEENNPFSSLLINLSNVQENNGRSHGHMVSASVDNKKKIDDILAREDIQKVFAENSEFLWSSEIFKIGTEEFRDLYFVEKETRPVLNGRYLRETKVAIGQDVEGAGRPEVHFTLNREGARKFGELTGDHIGEQLAIVLDNKVISAPRIQGKLGARSRITGISNMEEAKMIEIVLKAGALPVPLKFVEERIIKPSAQ